VWPSIRYIWMLTPVSHMCSIWLVVLISGNRYWAVCRPHSTCTVWTNRRTGLYVLFVVCLVVAFNAPRLFEYDFRYECCRYDVHTPTVGGGVNDNDKSRDPSRSNQTCTVFVPLALQQRSSILHSSLSDQELNSSDDVIGVLSRVECLGVTRQVEFKSSLGDTYSYHVVYKVRALI